MLFIEEGTKIINFSHYYNFNDAKFFSNHKKKQNSEKKELASPCLTKATKGR